MITKEYCNYLAHHGIPGMRRGHRRWQNEDGSYTEAGKIHYGIGTKSKKAENSMSNTNEGNNKLNFWQRITHNKKEEIRKKALEKNNYKKQLNTMQRDDWNEEAKRVQSLKKDYVSQENYKADLAFAKHQAKLSQNRVDGWIRREKRLMNMNVDQLSIRQVKKATKLKLHEYATPDK